MDSTDPRTRCHARCGDIYGRHIRPAPATAHARRYAQTLPAGSGIDSVQLSQHFQPASDRDRVSPAFLVPWDNAMMMIWDFKREGDALFQHLQGS